jgi:hypothetical protein
MSEWAVPQTSLKDLAVIVDSLEKPDDKSNRYGLTRIFDEYEYWDGYTDWYFDRILWFSKILVITTVSALGFAILAFGYGFILWGFLAAGLAGTSVSILMKLPPMSVYGETAPLGSQILRRYAAGAVGTAVGVGLLAVGIVNIPNFKEATFNQVLSEYEEARVDYKEGQREVSTNGVSKEAAARAGEKPDSGRHPMFAAKLFIMLAIGLLLGFSERSLSSYEDQLFAAAKSSQVR